MSKNIANNPYAQQAQLNAAQTDARILENAYPKLKALNPMIDPAFNQAFDQPTNSGATGAPPNTNRAPSATPDATVTPIPSSTPEPTATPTPMAQATSTPMLRWNPATGEYE